MKIEDNVEWGALYINDSENGQFPGGASSNRTFLPISLQLQCDSSSPGYAEGMARFPEFHEAAPARGNHVPPLRSGRWLLEQVMGHAPSVTILISEQLRARHIEYLPSIIPGACVFLPVRLDEVRPHLVLIGDHLGEPVL